MLLRVSLHFRGTALEDYGHVNRPKPAAERWYDPYWENGHWVFNRVKMQSTEHPLGHFLQKGKSTKHHDCNQICLGIYETYGEVCAQRFVTRKHRWRYEYKQFHNMCYLEYENCKELNKRWYPIHKGNCPEFKKMTKNPTDPSKAAKRVTKWMKRINGKQIGAGIADSYE
ncbi:unnamed protein product [Pieris macdunnoughi]|uniref:Uncharacterized protein n=1 Tax=Pieris macdunnoughi TaxID=345717 RepID=A0A821UCF0_9NEOP|nr:unnamed protein product [Pieris macdunnoughi]